MTTLIITRGLPGSGKSTYAKSWTEGWMTRARVNRDDLRDMLHGGPLGYTPELERRVTVAQEAQVFDMLVTGWDVIVDDMNLRSRYVRNWQKIAARAGAEFDVVDFTDVPVETCIQRDLERFNTGGRYVGGKLIGDLHQRFIKGKPHPLPVPEPDAVLKPAAKYAVPLGKSRAILVDVDGTVALMNGRGPYDWHRVGEDLPNVPVVRAVFALKQSMWIGAEVIFMSGRDEVCRTETEHWLGHQGFVDFKLYMRPKGDQRKDSVVKLELFDQHIRDNYDVQFVLDDRNQVVSMWRSIGLTCFQVAEGDF